MPVVCIGQTKHFNRIGLIYLTLNQGWSHALWSFPGCGELQGLPPGSPFCNRHYYMGNTGWQTVILPDVERSDPIKHAETRVINMPLLQGPTWSTMQICGNLFVSADPINLHGTKILQWHSRFKPIRNKLEQYLKCLGFTFSPEHNCLGKWWEVPVKWAMNRHIMLLILYPIILNVLVCEENLSKGRWCKATLHQSTLTLFEGQEYQTKFQCSSYCCLWEPIIRHNQ